MPVQHRTQTPLESDDGNEFTEIARQLRAGTEIGVDQEERISSALIMNNNIILQENAGISR